MCVCKTLTPRQRRLPHSFEFRANEWEAGCLVFVLEHAPRAHVTVVPTQALVEQVRSVFAEGQALRALLVIAQQ